MEFGMPTLLELESLEANVTLAQQLGLSFVEINCNVPQFQVGTLDPHHLRDLTHQSGIRFTFHLDEYMSITDPNPKIAQAYLESVLDSIAFAKIAGITTMTMHLIPGVVFTLPHKKVYVYEKYPEYYASRMRIFRDAVTAAIGDSPVRLNIENVSGFSEYMRQGLAVLLESPVIGLTYDCGHNHRYHKIDWDFLKAHAPRITHLHIHDCRAQQDHLPFGDGDIDLKAELDFVRPSCLLAVLEVKTVDALTETVKRLPHYQN
jgi:sugar phosphate isomerase/epimerase